MPDSTLKEEATRPVTPLPTFAKGESDTHGDSWKRRDDCCLRTSNCYFPSPLHRVLSPRNNDFRCSLVYFCYPPCNLSVSSIIQELSQTFQDKSPHNENKSLHTNNSIQIDGSKQNGHSFSDEISCRTITAIPYESYYILRNQSPTSSNRTDSVTTTNKGQEANIQRKETGGQLHQRIREEYEKYFYKHVYDKPIHAVLRDKWNQVQR
jgi:hypothetical protein